MACQAPLSMGLLGKNTGIGCHFPPPGELPDPGIKPKSLMSLAFQVDPIPAEPPGKPGDLKKHKFLGPALELRNLGMAQLAEF